MKRTKKKGPPAPPPPAAVAPWVPDDADRCEVLLPAPAVVVGVVAGALLTQRAPATRCPRVWMFRVLMGDGGMMKACRPCAVQLEGDKPR